LTAQAGPSLGLRIGVFVMLVLVLGLTYLFMVGAQRMVKVLGMTGTNVVERVLAIILAALAVQFVVDGARQAFAVQG
ncbi:MarC family protein, partial [Acinetobacter baumannii]